MNGSHLQVISTLVSSGQSVSQQLDSPAYGTHILVRPISCTAVQRLSTTLCVGIGRSASIGRQRELTSMVIREVLCIEMLLRQH